MNKLYIENSKPWSPLGDGMIDFPGGSFAKHLIQLNSILEAIIFHDDILLNHPYCASFSDIFMSSDWAPGHENLNPFHEIEQEWPMVKVRCAPLPEPDEKRTVRYYEKMIDFWSKFQTEDFQEQVKSDKMSRQKFHEMESLLYSYSIASYSTPLDDWLKGDLLVKSIYDMTVELFKKRHTHFLGRISRLSKKLPELQNNLKKLYGCKISDNELDRLVDFYLVTGPGSAQRYAKKYLKSVALWN